MKGPTLSQVVAVWAGAAAAAVDLHDFDWSALRASAQLNYTACYDGHKCAKLLVPMDWLDAENPERVTLAIVARPAVVDETDPSFGGTIIINPGGPSGAGVPFVLNRGKLLQTMADSPGKKYEFLSFDPRGVGFTTPPADCYNDEFARSSYALQDRAMGGPAAGVSVLRRLFSRSDGHGRLCDGSETIRGFMSTSSVARDMVEIVDKLHDLRHGSSKGAERDGDAAPRVELRRAADETPRIQYWGFSYGTVLGRYFASMFPGRVGRMVLEAVENVYDYGNATWSENLVDVQQALQHLWETCYEAGPGCALYHAGDSGPEDVQGRVKTFVDDLDDSPVPYIAHNSVVTITKDDVMQTIFQALYSPKEKFPSISESIAAAIGGNYTQLYEGLNVPGGSFSCPIVPRADAYTWSQDAQNAIACGDGEVQTNMTIPDFQDYLDKLQSDSPDFGAAWSNLRLACKGWRVRPKYRFTGPWVTPPPDGTLVEGKPAAPILFVSSTVDPVTPLRMAKAARADHPGSGLLVQNNVGHGTVTVPGRCRDNHIKMYWDTGIVPPEGTVCQPDCRPFTKCPHVEGTAWDGLTAERWHPLGMM
jgi:pimeloyl-ACP methyl ester carboxylesterase